MPSNKIDTKHHPLLKKMGLNLVYYRKQRELTQEALAEKAELSRNTINDFENATKLKGISLGSIFRIADALDIPAKKLFDFRDDD